MSGSKTATMKYLPIISLMIICLSCKKQADNNFASERKSISGTWELHKQYFGEGSSQGPGVTTYVAGNGSKIVFDEHGNFERWELNTLRAKEKYSLGRKADCEPTESNLFYYIGNDVPKFVTYLSVSGDKLTVSMSNCIADAATMEYLRIK